MVYKQTSEISGKKLKNQTEKSFFRDKIKVKKHPTFCYQLLITRHFQT